MNDSNQNDELKVLMVEVLDNQRKQIEMQSEAIGMQREQFRIFKEQFEKTSSIQDKADEVQERARILMKKAGMGLAIIIPFVIILMAYVAWIILK